jgi:hypothetical protein
MRRNDKEVVFLEVTPAIKDRLRRAAEVLSSKSPTDKRVDMADIGRAALIEKLDRLEKKHPEIAAA